MHFQLAICLMIYCFVASLLFQDSCFIGNRSDVMIIIMKIVTRPLGAVGYRASLLNREMALKQRRIHVAV